MTNTEKGKFGEDYVKEYLCNLRYQVRESSKTGSDIEYQENDKTFTVEVKTTENLKGGIPDMHDTEFEMRNSKWYFKADFLYVVRIKKRKVVQMDIVTKEEIDRFADSHKTVTRIRTTKFDRELRDRKVGKTITM